MGNQLDTSADTYDYVVIGAGSAGCVMANRLSEDPSARVLVLEAGDHDRHYAVRVPAAMIRMSPKLNWNYPAEPDASRNGLVDHWPGGKLVGGGSSINAMVWVRGNRADFDNWAALGCSGWDYDSVLPYFRKAENWEGGASTYRGAGGPQQVSWMRIDKETIPAFVSAANEAGLPLNDDYNAATQLGTGTGQVSQRNGLRASTARSYLAPASRRSNLTVKLHAHVSRIIVEASRAVGVEYIVDGRLVTVSAEREVILCAGAIASPKVLMLSGIGPVGELQRHGIKVVADLPGVGENLMEHPHGYVKYQVTESTLNTDVTPLRALRHGLDFALRRRGALTTGFNHAIAFAESDAARWVDIEMQMFAFASAPKKKSASDSNGLSHEINSIGLDSERMVSALPAFLHPSGRGTISLRSGDPLADPIIRHELLGHPDDMAGLLSGVKLAREIFSQPALKRYVVREALPGDSVRSDDDLRSYLRVSGFTGKHPSGTCRMGVDGDAVVDPQLRVRGVDGLRVVDASVMPVISSGNTNAPTIMIAERAADLVKADSSNREAPSAAAATTA